MFAAPNSQHYYISKETNDEQDIVAFSGNYSLIVAEPKGDAAYLPKTLEDDGSGYEYLGIIGLEGFLQTIKTEMAKPGNAGVRSDITFLLGLLDAVDNEDRTETVLVVYEILYEMCQLLNLSIDLTWDNVVGDVLAPFNAWLGATGYTAYETSEDLRVYTDGNDFFPTR